MKKKFIKLFTILSVVFLGVLEMGWRFFNMVVCCKRGEHKKERKKWFELSHIRENHPQNGYAREYNESKAWCFEQKMQDCYIKSIDGLKLHALYLPAEGAKRIVILSHGYRGSRFGTLSFMAKYLHEHQCDVLHRLRARVPLEIRSSNGSGVRIPVRNGRRKQWYRCLLFRLCSSVLL